MAISRRDYVRLPRTATQPAGTRVVLYAPKTTAGAAPKVMRYLPPAYVTERAAMAVAVGWHNNAVTIMQDSLRQDRERARRDMEYWKRGITSANCAYPGGNYVRRSQPVYTPRKVTVTTTVKNTSKYRPCQL